MHMPKRERPHQAIGIVLFALVCLAAFRSDLLLEYAYDLPVNPATERIVLLAEAWNAFTRAIGLNDFTTAVVEAVDQLRGTENGL